MEVMAKALTGTVDVIGDTVDREVKTGTQNPVDIKGAVVVRIQDREAEHRIPHLPILGRAPKCRQLRLKNIATPLHIPLQ